MQTSIPTVLEIPVIERKESNKFRRPSKFFYLNTGLYTYIEE